MSDNELSTSNNHTSNLPDFPQRSSSIRFYLNENYDENNNRENNKKENTNKINKTYSKTSEFQNNDKYDKQERMIHQNNLYKTHSLPKRQMSEKLLEKTEKMSQHTSIDICDLETVNKKNKQSSAFEPVRIIDQDMDLESCDSIDRKTESFFPSRRTLQQKDFDNISKINQKMRFGNPLTNKGSVDLPIKNKDDINDEIERKLQNLIDEWFNFCEKNSVLHSMCCAFYKKWGNMISLSAILLSTVGGATGLATNKEDASRHQIISIVLGIASLLSGSLMTIHRYFNFNQLEKDHLFYSSEYAKLKNEMHMQLYIHQCDSKTYVNLVEFCKTIKTNIDSLLDRGPNISNAIIQQYEEKKKIKKNESKIIPSLIFNKNGLTT